MPKQVVGGMIEYLQREAEICGYEASAENTTRLDGVYDSIARLPTNGGLVNPAEAVGRIARRHGIPYLLDACQAVGQMPIDVCALGCDMLTATGRKFLRGPRGTGFLYIRNDFLKGVEPAMIDLFGAPWVGPERYELRSDARRFETWEANYAARLGLGIAVDYALSIGIERIERRCRLLAKGLRELLAAIAEVSIHDLGEHPASIISFTISTWVHARSCVSWQQGKSMCQSRQQQAPRWTQRVGTFLMSFARRRITTIHSRRLKLSCRRSVE